MAAMTPTEREVIWSVVDRKYRPGAVSDETRWRLFRRICASRDDTVGMLARDAPPTWTDSAGKTRRTSSALRRPKSTPGWDALRAFVIQRDGNECCWCGATSGLVVDHIISRRNGGAHHPDNLRALCDPCNAAKVGLVDTRKGAT